MIIIIMKEHLILDAYSDSAAKAGIPMQGMTARIPASMAAIICFPNLFIPFLPELIPCFSLAQLPPLY